MKRLLASLGSLTVAATLVLGGAIAASATEDTPPPVIDEILVEKQVTTEAPAAEEIVEKGEDVPLPNPEATNLPDVPPPSELLPLPPINLPSVPCYVTASTVIGPVSTFTVGPAGCDVPTPAISFSGYNLPGGFIKPFFAQVATEHATEAGVQYLAGNHVLTLTRPLPCNWQTDLYWSPDGQNQPSAPHSHPLNGMNVGWDYSEGNDCTPPPPPAQECVVTFGTWFTEKDDTVPTLEQDGIRFIGGINDSVGTGIGIGGNLQGLPEITYVADGDAYSMARFYPRIVINSGADGGPTYNSITVTSEGPVNGSSVASGRIKLADGGARVSKTIDEWIAFYPNNTLRAFFFNTDSSSNADVSVLLKSVSSKCFGNEWGYGSQPDDDVTVGEWVKGKYFCEDTSVDEQRLVTTTTYELVDGKWVGTTSEVYETRSRDLTEEELEELADRVECNQPPTEVVNGAWEGKYQCGDKQVTETRTVSTTTYKFGDGIWIGTTVETLEEQTRDLTNDELVELDCPVPGVDVLQRTGFDSAPIGLIAVAALLAGALGIVIARLTRRVRA